MSISTSWRRFGDVGMAMNTVTSLSGEHERDAACSLHSGVTGDVTPRR